MEKFLEILDNIEDNDEVYFDITHLFRSVSVMSFIMAEFGKTYKNFKLAGIYYGMLKKDEPSLIIDISMFFDLLEWAKAIEEISALKEPIGRVLDGWVTEDGLKIEKVSIAIGVIGIIYESRPNVTSDTAALCFKSSNVCVLKGGKEADNSN